LIDEKVCQRLVEVGNVIPAISIEGYRKETDERRGVGHFDRIMNDDGCITRDQNLVWIFSHINTTKYRNPE